MVHGQWGEIMEISGNFSMANSSAGGMPTISHGEKYQIDKISQRMLAEMEQRDTVGTSGLVEAAVGSEISGASKRVRYRMDNHLIPSGLAREVPSSGQERVFEMTSKGADFVDEHREAIESVGVVREMAADAENAARQAEEAAGRVDEIVSRLESVEGTAGAATRDVSALREEIDEVQSEVATTRSEVSSVESRLKSLDSIVSIASGNAEEAVVRSEKLEEEVETLRSEIKELQSSFQEQVSELEDRHETFAEEAVKRVSDERKFADELAGRIDEIDTRVSDLEDQSTLDTLFS